MRCFSARPDRPGQLGAFAAAAVRFFSGHRCGPPLAFFSLRRLMGPFGRCCVGVLRSPQQPLRFDRCQERYHADSVVTVSPGS